MERDTILIIYTFFFEYLSIRFSVKLNFIFIIITLLCFFYCYYKIISINDSYITYHPVFLINFNHSTWYLLVYLTTIPRPGDSKGTFSVIESSYHLLLPVYQSITNHSKVEAPGGGGATRPLPRDGGVEELHGDPTVGRQSRREWVRFCRGCPQTLHEEFSFRH